MRVYFSFDLRTDLRYPLEEKFPQVDFIYQNELDEIELVKADVLVTYGEDLNEHHIDIAKNLKWIFVVSAGIERMPNEKIAERGILVSNVRGIHKKPMAESIIAHILSVKRAIPFIFEQQQKREWNRKTFQSELNGSTALIIGTGAIGSEVGRLLQAFEVYTIGVNRSGNAVDYMNETYPMNEIKQHLSRAEIIISILPSTKETKHVITYEHFQLMRSDAIFMNFGRGDVVDADVLIQALEEKQIFYAVIDAFEEEPLPATSRLWELENITISPHISSHSKRYLERSLEIFEPSLEKWLNGERDLENKMNILRGY